MTGTPPKRGCLGRYTHIPAMYKGWRQLPWLVTGDEHPGKSPELGEVISTLQGHGAVPFPAPTLCPWPGQGEINLTQLPPRPWQCWHGSCPSLGKVSLSWQALLECCAGCHEALRGDV